MYLLCNIKIGLMSQTIFLVSEGTSVPIATAEASWLPHVLVSLCEEHEIEAVKLSGLNDYLIPIIKEITNLNKNIKIEVIEL